MQRVSGVRGGELNQASPVNQDDAVTNSREARTGHVGLAIREGALSDHLAKSPEGLEVYRFVGRRGTAQGALNSHQDSDERTIMLNGDSPIRKWLVNSVDLNGSD